MDFIYFPGPVIHNYHSGRAVKHLEYFFDDIKHFLDHLSQYQSTTMVQATSDFEQFLYPEGRK